VDDLKETRGHCKFKEEELDRTLWRIRFGRRISPKRDYSMMMIMMMNILTSRYSPSTANRNISGRSPYNSGA